MAMAIESNSNAPSVQTPDTLYRSLKNIPESFIWPDEEKPCLEARELPVPIINLGAFLSGDPDAVKESMKQVREACETTGVFFVVNHGIDNQIISDVHRLMQMFFDMPLNVKQRHQLKAGESIGYANSLNGRFSSKFPWKESLAFPYVDNTNSVEEYFTNAYGKDFQDFGKVYQEYCDKMNKLGFEIMELLGMSIGIDRLHYPKIFEGNDSILRLNYYPPCQEPHLTLGIGAHSDPNALTILHEDEVLGLQVCVNDEWFYVRPNAESFAINIGDTFVGLTNGRFKGCLHRAVVNTEKQRKSISFFMSPKLDKKLMPPSELVDEEHPRMYPDFTWGEIREFVLNHYRTDMKSFDAFCKWVQDVNK